MAWYDINKKKLECLYAWSMFYQNSPNLKLYGGNGTFENIKMFEKTQKEIKLILDEAFTVQQKN